MAYLSFEHKANIDKPLKRRLYSAGSGGDFVHCEIVLNEYDFKVCSSWYPDGVQIRDWANKEQPENWLNYDLGSIDLQLLAFFKEKEGTPYTLRGLAFNMIMNGGFKSNKTFCSQICLDSLRHLETYHLPAIQSTSISPNDLEQILRNYNFTPINTHIYGTGNQIAA